MGAAELGKKRLRQSSRYFHGLAVMLGCVIIGQGQRHNGFS